MLISLSDLKTKLGISGSTYDTFLTDQIELVSQAIEAYCRRKFEETDYIQTYYREDVVYPRSVDLYQFPVKTIASVVEKESSVDAGTTLDATAYRINKSTGRLINECGYFFNSGKIVEVTYTAGYATADMPAPIINAVVGIVQERYNKKIKGIDLNFGSDVQRISIPGTISIDYDFSLTSNDRSTPFGQILGNYVNTLDFYRSDRAVVGDLRLAYVEEVP